MSGTAPMSPSTSPDTTVNTGGSASAPAGMVSGDGGHLNTGATPVFNMAGPQGPPLLYGPGASADPLQVSGVSVDPLQGPGDPWATTPWISFAPSTSPAGLPGSRSSGSTGTWQTGNSGQSGTSTATFGMPPGFLDSGFSGEAGTAQASTTVTAVDPVTAQMLRQQMLLTQGVMDLLYRTGPGLQQQPVQQTPTVAQNSGGSSEKLTMDTKWIPAAPLPDWKSWNNRARELSGFKGWLEKFASWLCLVHDSYASELKEAMNLPYPVVIVNQDQAIRSRRLFHLLQQSFCQQAVIWETYRVVILMSCQSTTERTMRALDLQLACDHPKRLVCWGQLIYLRLTPFSSTSTLVNLCDVVILIARHGSFDCADCRYVS